MIYCEGGDMYNKIKNMKGKTFSENVFIYININIFNFFKANT